MVSRPGKDLPIGIAVTVVWADIVEMIHADETIEPIYFRTLGIYNGWYKDARGNWYLSTTNTKRDTHPFDPYGSQSYPAGCVMSVDVFPPRS